MLSTNSLSCHTTNTTSHLDDKNIKKPDANSTNTNRNAILSLIVENPGIRYRELLRLTDLSNGVLAYHLKQIEKSKPILAVRQNKKTTRYYSSDIPFEEILIIGQVRHSTTRRRILTFILKHKVCTFDSIVEHSNKAPSTVSWHLKALLESKIVSVQKSERSKYLLYRLNSIRFIGNLLSKFRNTDNDNTQIKEKEEFLVQKSIVIHCAYGNIAL